MQTDDLTTINLPHVYKSKKKQARWHFTVIDQTPLLLTFRVGWQPQLSLPVMPRYECEVSVSSDDLVRFKGVSLLTGEIAESIFSKKTLLDTQSIIWWLKISLNFSRENFLMSNGKLGG